MVAPPQQQEGNLGRGENPNPGTSGQGRKDLPGAKKEQKGEKEDKGGKVQRKTPNPGNGEKGLFDTKRRWSRRSTNLERGEQKAIPQRLADWKQGKGTRRGAKKNRLLCGSKEPLKNKKGHSGTRRKAEGG